MGIHLAQVGTPIWSVLAAEQGEAVLGITDKGSPWLFVGSPSGRRMTAMPARHEGRGNRGAYSG